MTIVSQTTTRADRVHAALMLLAAVLTAAYWIVYFTSGDTQLRQDAVYIGFENAFPLADGWMALCYLLGGIALLRQRPAAVLWGLCGGSAMIFLACMDLLFNLQQGHFGLALTAPLLLEFAIVTACWLMGAITIRRLWRHPLRLEAGRP